MVLSNIASIASHPEKDTQMVSNCISHTEKINISIESYTEKKCFKQITIKPNKSCEKKWTLPIHSPIKKIFGNHL